MRFVLTIITLLLVSGQAPAVDRIIAIQPMGHQLPPADVALVKNALEVFYGVKVEVMSRVPLPKAAFYPPRKRYRAEALLDFLRARKPDTAFRVLGLTGSDISTTKGAHKDWGVLGLATLDGTACVISSYRTRRRSTSRLNARQRLAKVAVHEIGHTFGLDHCPTEGCLMEDAKGSVLTSDREYDLCPRCRHQIKKRRFTLPAQPQIPWPRPRRL